MSMLLLTNTHCQSPSVYFYNFGYTDMDIPTIEKMMSIVQVISFSVFERHGKVMC